MSNKTLPAILYMASTVYSHKMGMDVFAVGGNAMQIYALSPRASTILSRTLHCIRYISRPAAAVEAKERKKSYFTFSKSKMYSLVVVSKSSPHRSPAAGPCCPSCPVRGPGAAPLRGCVQTMPIVCVQSA